MKIKGAYCLFFILSGCFSQALALDFSYKSDIPIDNKPSEEYLKKRDELNQGSWSTEKLAEANALAEKRENELKEYNDRSEQKNRLAFSYDWDDKQLKLAPHMQQGHPMQNIKEHTKRRCYRETRQKLQKEKGNAYSNADIADSCGFYH
ncbi:hypothetical protein [Xenorhabdus hominickii]|uniref:Uncharacterized protein n=1 Tax=Xenorhabdus hominickii TaxID=351679 RepID=A0A2G0Q6D2_XENHO|nr:hypothetical protein [Xenorhabdus hominickii]AOM39461.1 hypothetical protein A9255_01895 [Xenorhabdus hominickii]PHM54774.1 hypothetical protein Xhom_02730 [Xenorhabdus hominickii]